jgi:hypothetical protein
MGNISGFGVCVRTRFDSGNSFTGAKKALFCISRAIND